MKDIYVRIDDEELGSWTEVTRPERERRQFNFAFALSTIFSSIFGVACWVGIMWFFVWAAVGGWRWFHHAIDQLMAAFHG